MTNILELYISRQKRPAFWVAFFLMLICLVSILSFLNVSDKLLYYWCAVFGAMSPVLTEAMLAILRVFSRRKLRAATSAKKDELELQASSLDTMAMTRKLQNNFPQLIDEVVAFSPHIDYLRYSNIFIDRRFGGKPDDLRPSNSENYPPFVDAGNQELRRILLEEQLTRFLIGDKFDLMFWSEFAEDDSTAVRVKLLNGMHSAFDSGEYADVRRQLVESVEASVLSPDEMLSIHWLLALHERIKLATRFKLRLDDSQG